VELCCGSLRSAVLDISALSRLFCPARVAAVLFLGVSSIWSQTRVPRIGDVAPPLKLGVIVHGSISQTPGRAMLLEFWAASCPPCVAAIPHLNDLAKEFKGSEIDFVLINAYEKAEIIQGFLQAHPMDGMVAVDGSPGMVDAFGIESIPVTVLVSREGRVAAVGNPSQITAVVLKTLLLGEAIHLSTVSEALTTVIPTRHSFLPGSNIGPEERSLVRVVILPAVNDGILVSGTDQFESTGSNLKTILSSAYDISPFRVFVPSRLSEAKYELQACVPRDSPESLRPLIQIAISSAAAIDVKRGQRKMAGFILKGLPGKLVPVNESQLLVQCEDNRISGSAITPEVLRECVEKIAGKPVLLPVRVTGKYRIDLRWDSSKPTAFDTALKEQLGLTLTPVRRRFDVLTVEESRR
jgi:uncharacterized protein (TIGR03435 family)